MLIFPLGSESVWLVGCVLVFALDLLIIDSVFPSRVRLALSLFLGSGFDFEFTLVPRCLGHVWWFELVIENRP